MKNIGIDIVEIKRIKLKKRFIERVLSKNEFLIFNSFLNKKRKKEFIAGRWAAKEAYIKAVINKVIFNKIDIFLENETLFIAIDNKKISAKISISHETKYAIAIVFID